MGLDMYLYAEIYLGDDYSGLKEKLSKKLGGDKNSPARYSYEIGYWRKANAIHNWFVTNVQEGKDDCGDYSVSIDQLKELLAICLEVLYKPSNAKSKRILPTTSGFFFGGVGYDEYYYESVRETIHIIKACLQAFEDNPRIDFQYGSSW